MLSDIVGLFGVVSVYLILGAIVTMLTGGHDPLDGGPWYFIFIWPLVALLVIGDIQYRLTRDVLQRIR